MLMHVYAFDLYISIHMCECKMHSNQACIMKLTIQEDLPERKCIRMKRKTKTLGLLLWIF